MRVGITNSALASICRIRSLVTENNLLADLFERVVGPHPI